MKKEVKLNDAQIAALAPYEKYFGTAIRSGYAQHPGTAAIETMRTVWAELTGQRYPMNLGCTRCLMNLLKDIGTLYFAAKGIDPYTAAQRIVKTYPKHAALPVTGKLEKLAEKAEELQKNDADIIEAVAEAVAAKNPANKEEFGQALEETANEAAERLENGGTADGGTTAPVKKEKPKTGTKRGKNAKK